MAYIAGVSETRTVREWAEAARRPTSAAEDRLRLAHRVVTLISQSEGEAIVPTWFQGMNPQLGDRSLARVLHEDSFDEAGARPRRGERLRRRLMAGMRLPAAAAVASTGAVVDQAAQALGDNAFSGRIKA